MHSSNATLLCGESLGPNTYWMEDKEEWDNFEPTCEACILLWFSNNASITPHLPDQKHDQKED